MINKFFGPFQVEDNPYCVWDADIPKMNLEFLEKIDPDYFQYIGKTNFAFLEDSNTDKRKRQHAAIALRTGYSQGLETFFALLFSTIQAPHCIFAWLLKYQPGTIKEIIEKINNGKEFSSIIRGQFVNWRLISELIFSYIQEEDREKFTPYLVAFEKLWKGFALDFINPNFNDEYNSIKHGLRVRMGGFHLAMGKKSPLTKENSIIFSGNEFGSSFITTQKLDKFNFAIHQHSRNWHPVNYFHALHLISTSIKNIVSFLKHFHNFNCSELEYTVPNDLNYFTKPWELISETTEIKFSPNPDLKKLKLLSKDEIKAFYNAT